MRIWVKRILLTLALLAVAGVGYGAWRFQHPAMPAGAQTLASGMAPEGNVTERFFGTTTLAFSDGKNAIMIDALLTRPGMGEVLLGKVASDPALVGSILTRARLGKIDLLLVTHTHYDHALDVASVATWTGATIVGSPSTREVALGGGVPDARIRTIKGGERFTAGDFTVTAIRSVHSLGDRVPGEVTAPLKPPAEAKDYKEGGTFAYSDRASRLSHPGPCQRERRARHVSRGEGGRGVPRGGRVVVAPGRFHHPLLG